MKKVNIIFLIFLQCFFLKKYQIKQKSLDEIKGNVTLYKPEEIEFDPVNFQYKTDGDTRGVSNKLAEVKEWDNVAAGTIMVFEYRNGKKAIVDGHQRLGLAKRLSAQGKKIELLAHTFREVDGVFPDEAMVKPQALTTISTVHIKFLKGCVWGRHVSV